VKCEDISGVLKPSYGDHQLLAAYQSQFIFKSLLGGKYLQELTAAAAHLDHRVLVGLLKDFVQWQAAFMFIDGVKDWEVKQHLLTDSKRLMNKALNQNLEPKATKVALGPPTTLQEVWPGAPMRTVIRDQELQEWMTSMLTLRRHLRKECQQRHN
jgi:hypothetical protein